jgi:hypothetical protein
MMSAGYVSRGSFLFSLPAVALLNSPQFGEGGTEIGLRGRKGKRKSGG